MSIFGHANDAPIYKPAPWAKPLTHQVDEMKNNWVRYIEDTLDFLCTIVIIEMVLILLLLIILIIHIYVRI